MLYSEVMDTTDAVHVGPGLPFGQWVPIPGTDLEVGIQGADHIGTFWIRKRREENEDGPVGADQARP